MKGKGSFHKAGIIFTVLCLCGIISFTIAEATLRVLGISYPVFHTYDPIRGKALLAGKEGWYRSEGAAYIRINSAGFRDREHTVEKKQGTYRIAILGDSYMEARQVELKDTFGQRLEDYLRSCTSPQYNEIEVLSFGQGGYSTTDELLTLRHHVWPYKPDMVLTAIFHGNDLVDNFPKINTCQGRECPDYRRPFYYWDEGQLKLDSSFRNWTFESFKDRMLLTGVQYSRTLEVLNKAMRVINNWRVKQYTNFAFQETGLSEWVYAPPRSALHHEAWAMTEGILELLTEEIFAHHGEPFWALVTNPSQIDPMQRRDLKERLGVDTLDYPEQRIMKLGGKLHVPVVPLVYAFQKYVDEHQEYLHGFPNYRMGAGHWNEKGHDLAAHLVSEKVCAYLSTR
ncbi:SGNH/GDSL hydrolase family protein [Candidatus Nitrospira salsa]